MTSGVCYYLNAVVKKADVQYAMRNSIRLLIPTTLPSCLIFSFGTGTVTSKVIESLNGLLN